MMSKIKFIVPVLAFVLFVSAVPAHAEGLSSSQIQAILGLLNTFGADQATINSVSASLGGTPATTPVAAPAQTAPAPTAGSGSAASAPAATPAPSTACLTLSHTLALGQTDGTTGGEVSKLQKFLGGQVTGHVGPATATLLKKWQSAHGVTATGATGPKTRATMACSY